MGKKLKVGRKQRFFTGICSFLFPAVTELRKTPSGVAQ